MHDLETWTNVIPEISNVLTDGWVYLLEMCTLLTFWTCSLAVNAAVPPPAPEYMLHKVHYQVQQRRNREEFTQTPLGAAYIFGRTMQSLFLTSWGAMREQGPFLTKSLKREKEMLGHCILVQ